MTTDPTNASDKTACIIVAGGSGSRLGGGEPKQFRLLSGLPVVNYAVKFFGNHSSISELVVVVPLEWIDRAKEIVSSVKINVPLSVVPGGLRRQDSVYAGLRAAADCRYVAIHDGARPFPPHNLEVALQAAKSFSGGAIFAMPATDSIKLVQDEIIKHTVPRNGLWAAQTPQIFLRSRLEEALENCDRRGAEVTDDASAFEVMGWDVAVVPGSRSNIKITYKEDFIMAEALLKGLSE